MMAAPIAGSTPEADHHEKARTQLVRRGIKPTHQCMLILKTLLRSEVPVTAAELARRVGADAISMATIQRTLRLFVQTGLARLHPPRERAFTYEVVRDGHGRSRLLCAKCGRVYEVDDADSGALLREICERYGFAPATYRLEAQGRCLKCPASHVIIGRAPS